jgi:hypothetical protein
MTAWRERRAKSRIVNWLSYRNHFWLLVKNLDFSTFLLYAPWLVSYELGKLAYLAIFETRNLGAVVEAVAGVPEMLRRRKATMSQRKVEAGEIRKWFRST